MCNINIIKSIILNLSKETNYELIMYFDLKKKRPFDPKIYKTWFPTHIAYTLNSNTGESASNGEIC